VRDRLDTMRKAMGYLLAAILALACIMQASCDYLPGRDKAMDGTELDSFYTIRLVYNTATTTHRADEVTKIAYSEFGLTSTDRMASIDLLSRRLYLSEPCFDQGAEDYEPYYKMSSSEVKKVRSMLKRHGVLGWELVNGTPIEEGEKGICFDGGGWSLLLQYSDNTVDRFMSYGDNNPDTYKAFIEELLGFANARRDVSGLYE
jgi:hypothetical protein